MRTGRDFAHRVWEVLTARIKAKKGLTIRAVEDHFGMSHSWWRNLAGRPDGLQVGKVYQLCQMLDCSISRLLEQVEDEFAVEPSSESSVGGANAGGHPSAVTSDCDCHAALLDELDEDRFAGPAKALASLTNLLPALDGQAHCRALAIAGSCLRQLHRFEEALFYLKRALQIADSETQGDVYQRLVYASRLQPADGPMFAQKAIMAHSSKANFLKVGQAYVDLGYSYCMLVRWPQALEALDAAANYVRWLNDRNKITLHQLRAQVFAIQDRKAEALEQIRLARLAAPKYLERAYLLAAHLDWTKARISGEPRAYLVAIETLVRFDAFDAACAAVELAAISRRDGARAMRLIGPVASRGLSRLLENTYAGLELGRQLPSTLLASIEGIRAREIKRGRIPELELTVRLKETHEVH